MTCRERLPDLFPNWLRRLREVGYDPAHLAGACAAFARRHRTAEPTE